MPSSLPRVVRLLLLPLMLASAGCATRADRLGPGVAVDLPRFMGQWHVIANIPYFAERGKVATSDVYALRPDGRIDNFYVFRRGFDQPEQRWEGVSEVVPGSQGGHWKVQFIWPLKADLLVLDIDPDYRWALLGEPKRRYAWIFSRDPDMDAAQYENLRARFARFGYEPERILRVPQFPQQAGQPGFQ